MVKKCCCELKGGIKPNEKDFFNVVKTSYDVNPPQMVGNFLNILNTETLDAWLNQTTNSIIISVRGTDTKDMKDIKADASLVLNKLSKSDRYLKDKYILENLIQMFPPSDFEYYITGHSLGGAVSSQLKRDFPFIKDAVLYNGAFQPWDLFSQQSSSIKRNYTQGDPLYNLGGRFFINKKVIPSVPPINKDISSKVYSSLQAHNLDNFSSMYGGNISPQRIEQLKRMKKHILENLDKLDKIDLKKIIKAHNLTGLSLSKELLIDKIRKNKKRFFNDAEIINFYFGKILKKMGENELDIIGIQSMTSQDEKLKEIGEYMDKLSRSDLRTILKNSNIQIKNVNKASKDDLLKAIVFFKDKLVLGVDLVDALHLKLQKLKNRAVEKAEKALPKDEQRKLKLERAKQVKLNSLKRRIITNQLIREGADLTEDERKKLKAQLEKELKNKDEEELRGLLPQKTKTEELEEFKPELPPKIRTEKEKRKEYKQAIKEGQQKASEMTFDIDGKKLSYNDIMKDIERMKIEMKPKTEKQLEKQEAKLKEGKKLSKGREPKFSKLEAEKPKGEKALKNLMKKNKEMLEMKGLLKGGSKDEKKILKEIDRYLKSDEKKTLKDIDKYLKGEPKGKVKSAFYVPQKLKGKGKKERLDILGRRLDENKEEQAVERNILDFYEKEIDKAISYGDVSQKTLKDMGRKFASAHDHLKALVEEEKGLINEINKELKSSS